MRWPLRYQILVPVAGVMLLALAGVSVLSAYLAATRTHSQVESQLHQIATTLHEASVMVGATPEVIRKHYEKMDQMVIARRNVQRRLGAEGDSSAALQMHRA